MAGYQGGRYGSGVLLECFMEDTPDLLAFRYWGKGVSAWNGWEWVELRAAIPAWCRWKGGCIMLLDGAIAVGTVLASDGRTDWAHLLGPEDMSLSGLLDQQLA